MRTHTDYIGTVLDFKNFPPQEWDKKWSQIFLLPIGDVTTVSSILNFVTIKNLISLNMYVINYLKYAVKLKENSLIVIFFCYV